MGFHHNYHQTVWNYNKKIASLRASSLFGSHARYIFKLSIWVSREIYFGREPREDWGGGELGRACCHDWRIFISTSPGRSEIPLAEKWHASINFALNLEMYWIAFLEVGTCENRKSAGEEEMLFFPRYRISVDSVVVPLKFSTKAGTENLFQPSKQKGSIGVVPAKQCENMGLKLK